MESRKIELNQDKIGIIITVVIVATFAGVAGLFSITEPYYPSYDVSLSDLYLHKCGTGTFYLVEKNTCIPIEDKDFWLAQIEKENQLKFEVKELRTLIEKGDIVGYCYLFRSGEEICTPQK